MKILTLLLLLTAAVACKPTPTPMTRREIATIAAEVAATQNLRIQSGFSASAAITPVAGGAFLPLSGGTLTGTVTAPSFEATNSGGGTRAFGMSGNSTFISFISSTRIGLYYGGVLRHDFQSGGYSNVTGNEALAETTAPTFGAGSDVLYADSTTHGLMASYNNDAGAVIARSASKVQSGAYTNATASFTTVLTMSLPIGQWDCQVDARYTESTAADGMQLQVTSTAGTVSGGGVQTYCQGEQDDGTAFGVDTDAASQTCNLTDATTSAGHVSFHVDILVTGTLTYELQGKQNSHSTGTLTVAGSSMMCVHM